MTRSTFQETLEAAPPLRPDFAIEPAPGQESVWDYPRPPVLKPDSRLIEVRADNAVIARTRRGYKVMETASPPTFYIPREDVDMSLLARLAGATICEWKGVAAYWALSPDLERPVAWSYERPRPRFNKVRGYLAFYPGRVECFLDGERVLAQAGNFYGGWITSEICGPYKGDPGTGHW